MCHLVGLVRDSLTLPTAPEMWLNHPDSVALPHCPISQKPLLPLPHALLDIFLCLLLLLDLARSWDGEDHIFKRRIKAINELSKVNISKDSNISRMTIGTKSVNQLSSKRWWLLMLWRRLAPKR